MSLLEVDRVSHWYATGAGQRPVLNAVNMMLDSEGVVAVVGESGCGKTTLGRLVTGLIHPSAGEIRFEGRAISSLKGSDFRSYRRGVQLVQQDPYGSLNPGLTVEDILGAALLHHKLVRKRDLKEELLRILEEVDLDPTPDFLARYPHQLSGGQRQRVAIARSMSLRPQLLVADEATSMLDVSMRVSVLDLLLSFRSKSRLAYLFISHDFGVVRYFAQGGRILVMFYGVIVEEGPTEEIIHYPRHPYTFLLLQAIPVPDPAQARHRNPKEISEGLTAEPAAVGCIFSNRCPFSEDRCRTAQPPLSELTTGHLVSCWFPEKVGLLDRISRGSEVNAEASG